jgi:hypothetical protein
VKSVARDAVARRHEAQGMLVIQVDETYLRDLLGTTLRGMAW